MGWSYLTPYRHGNVDVVRVFDHAAYIRFPILVGGRRFNGNICQNRSKN